MATLNTAVENSYVLDGVLSRFKGMARAAGTIMMQAAESRSRTEEIERLKQLTDAELEQLGIRSEGDLVRYAFRDLMAF